MNGKLRLKTVLYKNKTIAEDIYFTPPFKLYSPFYKNNTAQFILMCASAGTLAGDKNEINLDIGNGCNVYFSDQGYQKLFDTHGDISAQTVNITVGENACMRYMPHPVITFGGCIHTAENTVNIKSSSTLIFAETYCCGRTAMGEEFALKKFHSRTEIRIDGKADFIDNTLIEPDKFPIRNLGFFEGYTHIGIVYVYAPDSTLYEDIKNACQSSDYKTVTAFSKCDKGFTVRVFSDSAENIERFYESALLM